MSGELKNKTYAMRHSLAHIMANAIQHVWPEAKFGVGPVIENGFYYDVDLGEFKLSEEHFRDIETEMRKIIETKEPFEQFEMPIEQAVEWAKQTDQPYKLELLNDLQRSGTTVAKDLDAADLGIKTEGVSKVEKVSFYRNGDFTDLCRGPHAPTTGNVGAFKLMRVSGAYWRGNEVNQQMQRIYGVAFDTEKELKSYLNLLEEAKLRDHRKLGQELDLYVFSELVGAGLPMFTPRGTVLREQLANFSNQLREKNGFQKVWSPHITKKALYETSGHWAKFGNELFLVRSQETSDEMVMKPMSCPHHTRIYASKARSYRDLPIRYLETATVYRDEKTGELGGLNRVRSITQDDSHVFCMPDQIENEINLLLQAARDMYKVLDMSLRVRLSYRDDEDVYLGDAELWQSAQKQLKNAVEAHKLEYFEQTGEAAFYGPKIDFMAADAIGREHQVATIQLDFVQPERFQLKYADEDGKIKTPVMVHSTLLGSLERFLAVYIEHTEGKFPIWLAPEQVRVLTINQEESTINYSEKIGKQAMELDVRLSVDDSNESVSKKIRNAELMKVPYVIVIGDKEIESGRLTPRIRKDLSGSEEAKNYSIDEFLNIVAKESKLRASTSSL